MFNNSKRILVVDDMTTIRKIVKKALSELDYKNVVEARDGQEAWNTFYAESQDFEFIISDWNMPIMTGIQFLEKVRADEKTKKIPFIFLTAESDVSQVKQAIETGADNYILKPFSTFDLKTKIEQTYTKVKDRLVA